MLVVAFLYRNITYSDQTIHGPTDTNPRIFFLLLSFQLALATYAAVAAPIVAMKFTGKKDAAVNVIQASSQDEEAFIREFIKAAEEDQPKNV